MGVSGGWVCGRGTWGAVSLSWSQRASLGQALVLGQLLVVGLGLAVVAVASWSMWRMSWALEVFGGAVQVALPLGGAVGTGLGAVLVAGAEAWRSRDVATPSRRRGATLRLSTFYYERGALASVSAAVLTGLLLAAEATFLRVIVPPNVDGLFRSTLLQGTASAMAQVNALQQGWRCCGLTEQSVAGGTLPDVEMFWPRHGFAVEVLGHSVPGSLPWSCCRWERPEGLACFHLGYADARAGPAWARTAEERLALKRASVNRDCCAHRTHEWVARQYGWLVGLVAVLGAVQAVSALLSQYAISAEESAVWGRPMDLLRRATGFLLLTEPHARLPPFYHQVLAQHAQTSDPTSSSSLPVDTSYVSALTTSTATAASLHDDLSKGKAQTKAEAKSKGKKA